MSLTVAQPRHQDVIRFQHVTHLPRHRAKAQPDSATRVDYQGRHRGPVTGLVDPAIWQRLSWPAKQAFTKQRLRELRDLT